MKKLILIALLVLSMVLSIASCGNTTTNTDNSNVDPKNLVDLIENGYTIVRAREGTKFESDLSVTLRSAIEKATGVNLNIANDNKGDPSDFEILVGKTSRPESQEVYANIKEKEFVIKWVGTKLVIAGDGDMFLGRAYTYFVNNLIGSQSSLKIPKDYNYSYICLSPEEQLKQTALVEYPEYPEQIKRNFDYEVTVTQGDKTISIPVYNEIRQINNTSSLEGGDKYRRFCEFAFSGEPVTISVKVNIDMQSYIISPSTKGYTSTANGNVITFTVTEPGQIVLKLNKDSNTILAIFADQVELDEEIPNAFDENVIYYGAGWHDVESGSVRVGSGKTLYLAPGAVLNARVTVEGENVKVMGRGMIRDPFDNRMETSQSNLLNCQGATNLTVQDVKLVDARTFNLVLSGVKNATVKNLKCLSNQVSTDGISFFGATDSALVENCFLHVTDNMFVFGGEATNYTVRNCFVGSDYALFYPQGNVPENTVFENIDAFRCSAFIKNTQAPSSGKSTMPNVVFRNINLLDVDTPLLFFYLQSQGDTIKKFTLQNVAMNALKDYQAVRAYDGSEYQFVFDNVFIDGKLFTSMESVAAEDNLKDTVYTFTSTNNPDAAKINVRKDTSAQNKAIRIQIGDYKLETLSIPAYEENGALYVAIADLLKELEFEVSVSGTTLTYKDSRGSQTAEITLKNGVAVAPITLLKDKGITAYTYENNLLKVTMVNRGENLIKNPGFEEKFTSNWCTYNHTRTFLSKEAHSGEYSVEINKTFNPVFGHGAAGLSHCFTDILEKYGAGTYKVECYAKLKSDTETKGARIGFVESSWQILTDTNKTVELTNEWQKISYEFNFANVSDYSSYNVFVGTTQGDNTYFYVDDFTLTKIS